MRRGNDAPRRHATRSATSSTAHVRRGAAPSVSRVVSSSSGTPSRSIVSVGAVSVGSARYQARAHVAFTSPTVFVRSWRSSFSGSAPAPVLATAAPNAAPVASTTTRTCVSEGCMIRPASGSHLAPPRPSTPAHAHHDRGVNSVPPRRAVAAQGSRSQQQKHASRPRPRGTQPCAPTCARSECDHRSHTPTPDTHTRRCARRRGGPRARRIACA